MKLQRFMRQYPLCSFFFMAYAFSWIILIPFILSQWNILPNTKGFQVFFVLNPFIGPTLSAYIMIRITEGKDGWHNLRNRFRRFKAGWHWYGLILLGIPLMMLLGIIIFPGTLASFQGFPPAFLITYIISFVVIFFGGGPLGEEIGWRGFALPRMQARYGALRATMLLGILWTFWHLPHFLTTAQRGGPGSNLSILYINLPIFLLLVMSITVIMTWFFNHTKESLFISILLHASVNTFSLVIPLFSAPVVTSTDLPVAIGLGVPAIAILIFTRGKLGYQAEEITKADYSQPSGTKNYF